MKSKSVKIARNRKDNITATCEDYDKSGKVSRRYVEIAGEEQCKKHGRYRGKSKPRSACEQCWRIYFAVENAYWTSF